MLGGKNVDYLVGSTGFVGTNLRAAHQFDGMFHSTDIEQAFGNRPDLLVYAGVPAEMFLANENPEKDLEIIEKAMEAILKIQAKQVVLISTIAVYKMADGVDERTEIEEKGLSSYGKNRFLLEQWVEERIEHSCIIRLPALYGISLKKNFIYDFIHRIPPMLSKEKYLELSGKEKKICDLYILQENGFYRCCATERKEKILLREFFEKVGFSALSFTDSRGWYQYYHLKELWGHIQKALKYEITKINLAVEPIKIQELYQELTGEVFENLLNKPVPHYNFKTEYAEMFGGTNGYIYPKETVLKEIKKYIKTEWRKEWGEEYASVNF